MKWGAFGKYIVETLKRFNPLQRTIARKKINDVLFSIDMDGASPTMTPQDCSLQRKYGKGSITSTICKSCGKEYVRKSAGVHEIGGGSLVYYSDDSDLCDECEKAITSYS